jgi:hypothetical protein
VLKASAFFGSRDPWPGRDGSCLGVWGFFEATHDPVWLGLCTAGIVFFRAWMDPSWGFVCCALMESLILAQDERWRRA